MQRVARLRRSRPDGFTIVETLIVLAIAGIFILIVFLAVPTLLRANRNSQRRQDVTSIGEALSHYLLNNSGNFPQAVTGPTGFVTTQTHLAYYSSTASPAQITLTPQTTNMLHAYGVNTSPDLVKIVNYQRCSTTINGAGTIAGAGYRDIVALYAVENADGSGTPQCEQF